MPRFLSKLVKKVPPFRYIYRLILDLKDMGTMSIDHVNKKKVLVTASTFPRWENDTEPRFILDLCKALEKYFDVTVLAPACPGAKENEVLEGVKVIRYHYFPIKKFETLCYPGAITSRIKEKKSRVLLVPFLFAGLWLKLFRILPEYDVVHAHWLIPQGIVQSFFKKPYIVTGHGGDVLTLNKGIILRLKIRCIKKARYVTVVSDYLKEKILSYYKIQNIRIISMGCDIKNFGPQFRKENYFGQEGRKVVLFVGRLVEFKGVSYLIDAVRDIDVILVIVGSGPLENQLKDQAAPIADKVRFLGAKPQQELRVIYASADVFVAPSVKTSEGEQEGLSTVIVEAMASGIPVIGSNSGGIPEIIKDGENGYLFPERDVDALREKIREILSSEEVRERFIKNGLETARQRDCEEMAEEYAVLLQQVDE